MTTSDPDAFSTTKWTRVAKARGDSEESRRALAELCEIYYAPVDAFILATTRDTQIAQDLTHAFFARVLESHAFDGADRDRGRFRSFLLGAVKHFLAETQRRAKAAKRGGQVTHESLDHETETSPGRALPDQDTLPPDAFFDRRWALTVLQQAMDRVSREMAASDRKAQFTILKPWLIGDTAGLRQAEAANELGMSENAVKVAIHRLRKRFRESVKAEIGQTLTPGSSLEEELAHLEAALRRPQ